MIISALGKVMIDEVDADPNTTMANLANGPWWSSRQDWVKLA